jgi:phosphoserine phosphatase RsbX
MADRPRLVEWSVASRPVAGEARSGDQALVLDDGNETLVAAVDGVGHGDAAARAAERALAVLRDGDFADLVAVAERCHEALRDSRGAAIGLAVFRGDGTVSWLGVGNVIGRLAEGGAPLPSGGHCLVSHVGVLGDQLPAMQPATMPLRRGDLLVLATDGVDGAFADQLATTGSCDEIAGGVLRAYARESDDALVLAVRYLGGHP